MEAREAALEELESLYGEYSWAFDGDEEEDDPDYVGRRACELVTAFVMAGYRPWKALGEPEHIRYPAYSERGRSAQGNKIIPSTKIYLAPISDIFGLILRDT